LRRNLGIVRSRTRNNCTARPGKGESGRKEDRKKWGDKNPKYLWERVAKVCKGRDEKKKVCSKPFGQESLNLEEYKKNQTTPRKGGAKSVYSITARQYREKEAKGQRWKRSSEKTNL